MLELKVLGTRKRQPATTERGRGSGGGREKEEKRTKQKLVTL